MALVQSLLTAIVRADGDALVMHVGERPYVIASSGTIELSTHGLNLEAMSGMLGQLLPQDALRALDDFGAVEHELVPPSPIPGERFTVVAARGGDDVWIELRRHRRARSTPAREPEPVVAPPEAPTQAVAVPEPEASPAVTHTPDEVMTAPATDVSADEGAREIAREINVIEVAVSVGASLEPTVTETLETPAPADLGPEPEHEPMHAEPQHQEPVHEQDEPSQETLPVSLPMVPPPLSAPFDSHVPSDGLGLTPSGAAGVGRPEEGRGAPFAVVPSAHQAALASSAALESAGSASSVGLGSVESASSAAGVPAAAPSPDRWPPVSATGSDDGASVVVPLTRSMRIDAGPRGLSSRPGGIDRLLRVASSRGASALYLSSQGRPHIRIDGDMRLLEGEPVLTTTDVESAVLELMPESAREALRRGEPTEWVSDLADIGRIRCTTFRDYRGPGALFQMISARAASAEQLGLSREIQALSTESEGLVIVAGPRGSGKSTLIAAFVDLVNRRRADYVITLERQIRLVHDNRSSLISQREIRGSAEEIVAQARAALRENPDVLVIEDLRSPDVLQVALDAAGSGLLVFISVTAASATSAIERVLDLVPVERKRPVQAMLGETLRGAVAQVLLRKSGGGRLAARELLLNTAAVASLVTEGQSSQLPLAIDSGRRHGMVPLNDALVAFVQSGAVDVREVYRKAADRTGLLALLKREGIDTSFAERLA